MIAERNQPARMPAPAPAAAHALPPIMTLVVLSPLLIEVLFGSTPIQKLYLAVPELLVYGCGALIVRAVARRRGLG